MGLTKDTETGRFIRTRQVWQPQNWDEGYVDNNGYFRVYRPDCPNAWPDGYAKRYYVVWWLSGNGVVPAGYNLHHKNENKLDDNIDNLELKLHGQHTSDHNEPRKIRIICICRECGKEFNIKPGRLKEKGRGSYCSQDCYKKFRKQDRN